MIEVGHDSVGAVPWMREARRNALGRGARLGARARALFQESSKVAGLIEESIECFVCVRWRRSGTGQ